jgi:methionyl-tRNA formyltransferase
VTAVPEPGLGVRTLFLGSGAFAVPILEAVVASLATDVVAVVSAPDRPSGRHGTPTPVPVVAAARDLGLHVVQPPRLRGPEATARIAALHPELGVLADYGRIVPDALLDLPAHGILNVHPSLLPRHRGAAPIAGAILAGDTESGVTIIRMDAGLDTGPIVAARSWPLSGTETAPELEGRAAVEGATLLRESLEPWLAGRIDPARAAGALERQVRAYQPWPGTWAETVVGRIVIWRAEAVAGFETGDAAPGRFGRFGLCVSDGYLALREVQPAGGRRMTWDELVRGRPAIVGSDVVAAPDA